MWACNAYLDDFGRVIPVSLNSTGFTYPGVECILVLPHLPNPGVEARSGRGDLHRVRRGLVVGKVRNAREEPRRRPFRDVVVPLRGLILIGPPRYTVTLHE